MKTSRCRVQTQGLLFDIMPDHNRQVDDLDCMLHDAMWSSQDSAPDPARLFAALHTRIVAEPRSGVRPSIRPAAYSGREKLHPE
jgi:hypothetical protein